MTLTRKPTGEGITARQRPSSELLTRARQLRRDATEAERDAWELLRGRRLLGLRFRRQQIIGSFIVDFYCAELRLVVELDGPIHDRVGISRRDAERDALIVARGVRVVRLRNQDLTAAHLRTIIQPFMSPPPSPGGRGGTGVRGSKAVTGNR
jgi:very-short-patch-repair endonuclease